MSLDDLITKLKEGTSEKVMVKKIWNVLYDELIEHNMLDKDRFRIVGEIDYLKTLAKTIYDRVWKSKETEK